MSSATASIPRFLLPRSGRIWRRAAPRSAPSLLSTPSAPSAASSSASHPAPGRIFLRLSSSKPSAPPGPQVLAKPERFNPPSHGSRLPKKTPPRHYGGELSSDEAAAQAQRDYPGLMPPRNSRAHWFIHSRWIHVAITIGTLSGLAIWTFALNFKHTSPFADMLPPASAYLRHPVDSVRMLVEVLRLHEAHKTARVSEKRKRYVEDVAKRAAYRRAHGLPEEVGLFNQPMAKIRTDDGGEQDVAGVAAAAASPANNAADAAAAAAAAATTASDEGYGRREAAAETSGTGEPELRRLSEEERKATAQTAKGRWLGIF